MDRPSLDLKALCSTQHSPHELSIITLMDFKNSIKNASQESKMAFELLKKSKEASLQVRWENHIISLLLFFHSNLPTSSKYWRSKIATLSGTHCLSQYILTTETSLHTYNNYTYIWTFTTLANLMCAQVEFFLLFLECNTLT